MTQHSLGWAGIVRLGLVQTALGAIVVLTTSTMNRVMVVELALPATLPGLLVGLHCAVQILRPRLGFGSDVGGRRTPWIVGGMAVLAAGAVLAALSIAWMGSHLAPAIALAFLAFAMIGAGVGAAGTSLLVLLAKRVDPVRRAAAATTVWVMMIAGFIVTAALAGRALDPYSPAQLVVVTAAVALVALAVTLLAVWRMEAPPMAGAVPVRLAADAARTPPRFAEALRQVWGEARARQFAVFVFVSMLAFSMQDLIVEPFAGTVFGYTPGESTRLAGVQNGGVLAGMLLAALACSGPRGMRCGTLRDWTLIGCAASAVALTSMAAAALAGPGWPLRATIFALGVANGAYAVAAIGSMMGLVGAGTAQREGVRMGLWGAAQAIAFGLGGLLGTLASDLARWLLGAPQPAYAAVFLLEALLFVWATWLAARLGGAPAASAAAQSTPPMRVLPADSR
jgi:BCD family chlorophyll transporter-like MFS transporter